MDPRYSQDGERYTPPGSSSSSSTTSSARQSFNRFRESVPGRVSTLRGQIQALPDRFPQVAETIQALPDKLQSVPSRLQTLPDKLQTVGGYAQEQFAKLPDRLPNRPSSRSVSSSAPTSPVSDYSTTSTSSTSAMAMRAPEPDDPAYDPALAALAGSILYRSGYDHESGGPLLILCAASFPDAKQVDYNKLLPYVLSIIPSDDELGPEEQGGSYSVVFFSGGGGMPGTGGTNNGGASVSQGNRPSWAWTLQAYNLVRCSFFFYYIQFTAYGTQMEANYIYS
jgi:Rho GTPase-activating protein 1